MEGSSRTPLAAEELGFQFCHHVMGADHDLGGTTAPVQLAYFKIALPGGGHMLAQGRCP